MALNKGEKADLVKLADQADVIASWLSGNHGKKATAFAGVLRSFAEGQHPEVEEVGPAAAAADTASMS